jgi:PmbA protein
MAGASMGDLTAFDLLARGDDIVNRAGPGEELEVVLSWSRDTEVRAYDGGVESFTSATTAGVGIKIITDGRLGFASAGSLDDDVIAETLAEARDNARFASPDEHAGIARPDGVPLPHLDVADERLADVTPEQRIAMALDLEARIADLDPRICGVESVDYADAFSLGAIVSTAGIRTCTAETAAQLVAYVLAADGHETTEGFGFSVGRHPDDLDPHRCATDAVHRAVRLLGATPMPSQRTTVVFDPWVTAQFLGIVAEMFAADAVLKGRSPFAHRLGEHVASPAVNLVDDPTDARHWGATETDGEGLATRRNVLIDNGVASGYLYDSTTGRQAGTASTASAVRAGSRSTPVPGPQAVLLLPGRRSAAELIGGLNDAVLVQEVSGLHSGVNPVSGDFSAGIEGVRIRNGEPAEPIREVTVGSTIQRMLTGVVEVGADLEFFPADAAGVSVVIEDVTISGHEAADGRS